MNDDVPSFAVVVLGAGVSGLNAAAIALGMQAEVLLLDRDVARLREVEAQRRQLLAEQAGKR